MTDAFNVMEVATSGAGVLVAEMAKSSWQSVRDAMVGLFRQGNEEAANEELRVLDLRHTQLVGATETEQEAVAEEVRGMLAIQLAAFLQRCPDAATGLMALVRERENEAGTAPAANMTARGNTNSQVIMSGNSITGGNFTYRPDTTR